MKRESNAPENELTIKPVTLGKFLDHDFPKRDAILKGLLYRQDLAMIYGPRGVGKTRIACEIAYAVASGGKFGPWKAPQARKVLLLDGEMAGRPLQKRIERIHRSEKSDLVLSKIRIVTPDMHGGILPKLDTVEGQDALQEAMPKGVELIIVDNLSCWTPSAADDALAWEIVARWARRRRSEGVAVVFMHHANKLGGQRGTSRKEDLLDLVLKVAPPKGHLPENATVMDIRFEKARELSPGRQKPRRAQFQESNGTRAWRWSAVVDATARQDQIRQLRGSGMSMSEIGKKLSINKSTVSRVLSRVGGQPG